MIRRHVAALLAVPLFLSACATAPMGPTVQVLPPQGKPFEQFQGEDYSCRQYAYGQVQGQAEEANNMGVLEGVGGTVLGAGLGAAVGGGRGAAIGAASGAVVGSAIGANTSAAHQGGIQAQYNNAYAACMTSKGNSVARPPAPRTYVVQPPPTVVYQAPPPPTVIYTAPPPPPAVMYPY